MGRSRTVDWLLLVTLLPAHLVIQGMSIRESLARGPWRGDALEPAEREISVLFVDIRDYTRVTESHVAIRGRTGRFDVFALPLPEAAPGAATRRAEAP